MVLNNGGANIVDSKHSRNELKFRHDDKPISKVALGLDFITFVTNFQQ